MPLYMPYGLGITLPAMVLEYALGFGFIEALVTALIFAYIQRTDSSLLMESTTKASKTKTSVPA